MEVTMKMLVVAFAASCCASSLAAAGEPMPASEVCLQAGHINNTVVVDGRTILFHMNDGKVWKNTLGSECPGLKFERAFSEEIRGGTICSNRQMIRVMHRGNWCSLGAFTPYTPPPATK
jgi:hypothetical protein